MSDPQALHVTRNVIPGKLGVDLHLHRVHIPLVINKITLTAYAIYGPTKCHPFYLPNSFMKPRRLLIMFVKQIPVKVCLWFFIMYRIQQNVTDRASDQL